MKDHRCAVCKYQGDHNEKKIYLEPIWRDNGLPFKIALCYMHSWELFRMGQKNFLMSYRDNFMGYYGTESERELVKHLKTMLPSIQAWSA